MSSTHLSLHVHVVFGTKERRPQIDAAWRDRLHAVLGGTLRRLDVVIQAIGGTADHVHLLLGLAATHRLSDIMRDLKRASSAWVHENIGLAAFAWQDGYGAFSVGAKDRSAVCTYIANQAEHHRVRTFREEYMALLRRSGIEYDPRYLD